MRVIESMMTRDAMSARRSAKAMPEPVQVPGEKPIIRRGTTSITIRPYVKEVYQRVAGIRAGKGFAEPTGEGVMRTYSASSLYREVLEAKLPELEAELRKSGINPDELKAQFGDE